MPFLVQDVILEDLKGLVNGSQAHSRIRLLDFHEYSLGGQLFLAGERNSANCNPLRSRFEALPGERRLFMCP